MQDAWLRASRAGVRDVENIGGWLTTIVARVCLNLLRSRRTRREEPLDVHVPDPVVALEADPEQAALLGDAVGLALLVVLETLSPEGFQNSGSVGGIGRSRWFRRGLEWFTRARGYQTRWASQPD